MKKIAVIVGVLLIALGGYMYSVNSAKVKDASVLGVAKSEAMKLYRESGTVTASASGTPSTILDEKNDSIDIITGTKVRTDAKSSAYVIFPDNSMMSIDALTDVVIEYTPQKVSILQVLGNTYHRVRTLESGQQYEVKTPGTLAAVRGTKFAVFYDSTKKKSKISVTESKVQVFKTDITKPLTEVTQDILTKEPSLLVQQDTYLETDTGAPSLPKESQPMKEVDRNDGGWIQKNNSIDVIFDTEKKDGRKAIEKIREIRKEVIESFGKDADIETVVLQVMLRVAQDQKADLKTILRDTTEQIKRDASTPLPTPIVKPTTPLLPKNPTDPIPPVKVVPVDDSREFINQDTISETNDKFILDFDRRYNYWFPVYSEKSVLCARAKLVTPEIIRQKLTNLELIHARKVPNKEQVVATLAAVRAYCASTSATVDILEEAYTENYPF